jgi:hypothetical protein
MQVALKLADLGHLCDELSTHLQWVDALQEEFYLQGDAELAAGLPVTPLFERCKPGVTKSQVPFMDIVAVPLYRSFAKAFPGVKPLLQRVSLPGTCIVTWNMLLRMVLRLTA